MVPEESEKKGELVIWDLWQKGTDSIYVMCVMNNYASYYPHMTPEKRLKVADKEKKKIIWRSSSRNVEISNPLSALLTSSGDGSRGNTEIDCELPCIKVEATLISDVLIGQE